MSRGGSSRAILIRDMLNKSEPPQATPFPRHGDASLQPGHGMSAKQSAKDKTAKGRGTLNRIDARYLQHSRVAVDDGWYRESAAGEAKTKTSVTIEKPSTIITKNNSPDIPFEQSINPYRGCEHGCVYCYARPAHAYLDLSPGLDFESRLFAKANAVELLAEALADPAYQCSPIALGANTDPYQPIEREHRITRAIIAYLERHNHPLMVVSKSSLVERDIDLLAKMARRGLAEVFISVTTLAPELMRRMEPRASAPERRLKTLARLAEAGIPAGVMFAPVIPAINDHEMEQVLRRAAEAGAGRAGYIMLRLPHEIKTLFKEWLETHYPLKAKHVMSIIRELREGRENDARFHSRMSGRGVFAALTWARFRNACRKYGLNRSPPRPLDRSSFIRPVLSGGQYSLF